MKSDTRKSDARKGVLPAGAVFHEELASGWSDGYTGRGFRQRLLCFLPILDRYVKATGVWLDLGCGSGVLTKELLLRGAQVTAIDGSPAMLKTAERSVGVVSQSKVNFILSDVQGFPEVSDATIDGVLCSSVIEYVEQPCALLSEVARVLRPHGKLVISVPPKLSAVRVVQKVIRLLFSLVGQDRFSYLTVSQFEINPSDIKEWLSARGFVLDRVTEFDPLLSRLSLRIFRPSLLILEAHRKDDRGC
jgi:ubiquinone/menaquinone biosynthesis C-methylase UbiE